MRTILVWVMAAVSCAACASSSRTYTVTGAQSASGTCAADGYYVPGDTAVAFEVVGGSTFDFEASIPGVPALSTGTFDDKALSSTYAAVYSVSPAAMYFLCSANACADAQGNTISAQGSFTLSINATGPSTSDSGGNTHWLAPQGTLTVTMPAQPGSAASGTIVVNATF